MPQEHAASVTNNITPKSTWKKLRDKICAKFGKHRSHTLPLTTGNVFEWSLYNYIVMLQRCCLLLVNVHVEWYYTGA